MHTIPCKLIPSKFSIARGTHVLGIVLSSDMNAFGDFHCLLGVTANGDLRGLLYH